MLSELDKWLRSPFGKSKKTLSKDELEKRREKGRRFYRNNKEKVLAKNAEYRKNNPDKIIDIRKKYYEKSKVK